MRLSSICAEVRDFMSVPRNNPELLRAQYHAFSRQIPLLHVILLSNTWAVAYSFRSVAPPLLSFYFPAYLTLFCGVRLVGWWRAINVTPTHEIAIKALTRTNRLAGVVAVAFTIWAIALFPYGDAYAQAHIAFYMAITVIACIFCLVHLRPAASRSR